MLRQVPLAVEVPGALKAGGQVMLAGRFAIRIALLLMLTSPVGCGVEEMICTVQNPRLSVPPGGQFRVLASGAWRVLVSVPAEAVVTFEMIVLLMTLTLSASNRETPPPSQPATLLAMMLLVTATCHHWPGRVGKASTSFPLTCWKAMPPPLPLSAALPMIRLALITRPGPTPSLGPIWPSGLTQSWSVVAPQVGSASGVPMTITPPPLVGTVGLVLWLNRIELCSMWPFLLKPKWPKPPPSPLLRLPHTQLKLNL